MSHPAKSGALVRLCDIRSLDGNVVMPAETVRVLKFFEESQTYTVQQWPKGAKFEVFARDVESVVQLEEERE